MNEPLLTWDLLVMYGAAIGLVWATILYLRKVRERGE